MALQFSVAGSGDSGDILCVGGAGAQGSGASNTGTVDTAYAGTFTLTLENGAVQTIKSGDGAAAFLNVGAGSHTLNYVPSEYYAQQFGLPIVSRLSTIAADGTITTTESALSDGEGSPYVLESYTKTVVVG